MTRILIDLTDIDQWQGNHGGIQRVVYGITKIFYLHNLNNEVLYIIFSPEEKKFRMANFDKIYKRVENHQKAQIAPTKQYEAEAQNSKKLIKSLPKLNGALGVARKIIKPANILLEPPALNKEDENQWVDFTSEDIVMVMGKPWDNPDIQSTLSDLRGHVGFKLVQVVYDLIICFYPHLHQSTWVEPYSRHMTEVIRHSDLLLAISKSTATDLGNFAKQKSLTPPRVEVIRLGDTTVIAKKISKNKKPDKRIQKEFIACVGTIEIRKNHTLLYYTYKLAAQKGINLPQILLVGGTGWLSGDIKHLINNDPEINGKLILLHDIDDKGLAWIYQNCLFTVYPSMYEGWGLPIAESLAMGKLCIASNTSSMPEIAGNLIDYFSPYSPEECLEKIEKYTKTLTLINKEKEIKINYKSTSWVDTYRQIIEYIKTS